MRRTSTAIRSATVVVFLLLPHLAPVALSEDGDAEKIAKWIDQLNADRFITRELATEHLLASGKAVVAPLADKLVNTNRETLSRGTYILRELALSTDAELSDEAEEGLKSVAESDDPSVARQAAATLNRLSEIRHDRSLAELRRLGAVIETQHIQIGQALIPNVSTLELNDQWKGKPDDLRHLRWLPEVQHVSLEGENITDGYFAYLNHLKNMTIVRLKRAKITWRGLKQLAEQENLRHLAILYCPVGDKSAEYLKAHQKVDVMKLYGTQLTASAAERLQKEMKNTKVDYRQGAFLGIACDPDAEQCFITYLQPGGAAEKGGLQRGDLILKYNGKPAGNFNSLTKLIAENRPGDKAKIEIMRDGETLTKEIELGEWE